MKSATGISGLDDILGGGIPAGRPTVVHGGPGSGKTMLAMQYLVNGATMFGERGLMISFEESPEALMANSPLTALLSANSVESDVHFVDARQPEDAIEAGAFDLGGLIAISASLVKANQVKRIAIDGIDVLFSFEQQAANRRREIMRLLSWLTESKISSIVTMKASESPLLGTERFDLMEYAVDGVIRLKTNLLEHLARRTLTIVKVRGSSFVEGDHPYTIGVDGIRVLHPTTTTDQVIQSLDVRLSTGVDHLDKMLRGGIRKGTTTLITGLPGSAKTILAAAFLQAGLIRGERCLFIGFDEPVKQVISDAGSIGLNLENGVRSGLLEAKSFAPGGIIADAHYLAIEALIESHAPSRVVIDPITALEKAGGLNIAEATMERLVFLIKMRGITAVFTAIAESPLGETESTSMRVSTIADNWVHLAFTNRGGERNRTLTIVKARGTAHSNQMREMLLAKDGVTLSDVYTANGQVLLGTARLQKEDQEKAQDAAETQALVLGLERLDRAGQELRLTMETAQRGLDQLALDRNELLKKSDELGVARTRSAHLSRAPRHADNAVD